MKPQSKIVKAMKWMLAIFLLLWILSFDFAKPIVKPIAAAIGKTEGAMQRGFRHLSIAAFGGLMAFVGVGLGAAAPIVGVVLAVVGIGLIGYTLFSLFKTEQPDPVSLSDKDR